MTDEQTNWLAVQFLDPSAYHSSPWTARIELMLHTQEAPAAPVSNKMCGVTDQSSQVTTCTG